MRRGEVWWTDLPPPAGRRPVVLLSRNEAYAVRELVTVAPITTRARRIPTEVPLGPAEGLPKACVVNLDTIKLHWPVAGREARRGGASPDVRPGPRPSTRLAGRGASRSRRGRAGDVGREAESVEPRAPGDGLVRARRRAEPAQSASGRGDRASPRRVSVGTVTRQAVPAQERLPGRAFGVRRACGNNPSGFMVHEPARDPGGLRRPPRPRGGGARQSVRCDSTKGSQFSEGRRG